MQESEQNEQNEESEQSEQSEVEVRFVSDEASVHAFEMMRIRELAEGILANSEDLTRRLHELDYQHKSPYTRHFEHFMKSMIGELKKFQLEVQE